MRAKGAGKEYPVEVFRIDPVLFGKDRPAGPERSFGQQKFVDVLFRDRNVPAGFGLAARRHNKDRHRSVRRFDPGMGEIGELAVLGDDPGRVEFGNKVDDPAPADPLGLFSPDRGVRDLAVTDRKRLDRTANRLHAGADLRPFKRGPRGSRADHDPLRVPEHQLRVCPDIDHKAALVSLVDPGEHEVCDRVRAHVAGNDRKARDLSLGADQKPDLPGRDADRRFNGREERRNPDVFRVDAEKQVVHHGVPVKDALVDPVRRTPGALTHPGEEGINRADHERP